jgi:SAM-dependent methyltransferase
MVSFLPLLLWLGLDSRLPTLLEAAQSPGETPVLALRREAAALEPLVRSQLARDFLAATAGLSSIAPRKLYLDETRKIYQTEEAARSLSPQERQLLKTVPIDESYYYYTKYGSPLAYTRPLDLLGQAGLEDVSGRKILDFGYGTIGHLRLLAGLGADVTGVDVDPMLPALYGAPQDQGLIKSWRGREGRIRLINGRFPVDETIRKSVGASYDLIISKNTLKRGFVHPERPVDPRRLLNLGMEDAQVVREFYQALKPGGRLLIYNLCPAPSPPGKPYKNWAEGRSPFPKEVWETAGFRIIEFDRDDSETIRRFAHALGWDQGESPIDLATDLFALYTLIEKPSVPAADRRQ